MTGKTLIPVIVGVGDYKNASLKPEDAAEPLDLMLEAIQDAAKDTKLPSSAATSLLQETDAIDVVRVWTWPYTDLPGLLSQRLNQPNRPKHTTYLDYHGGNQPAKLLDQAARRISQGHSRAAIVTGGEALASLGAYMAAKKRPPKSWTTPESDVAAVFAASATKLPPSKRVARPALGGKHSVGWPIQVYPLYENAMRADRGQSIKDNHAESAKLYADFARVAESNPIAWNYGKPAQTQESIATISKKNRMIDFPYPLLMNAFNNVNLAAACILTSTEHAKELGIPESQWIYPLGGAGASESANFWERPYLHKSACISRSLDAGLQASGLSKDDIDVFDFYSCFPIVPKLACRHLGLSIETPEKPISLLGGLTSFGGAGNNYSMHALTAMTRLLRREKGAKHGLVLANGGTATYQYVVCLSTKPRKDGSTYPDRNPFEPELIQDLPVPPTDEEAEGEAVVETYTVDFGRDGEPTLGHVLGRLKSNNHRFVANHGDDSTLHQLASWTKEPIGRSGRVSRAEDGRNVFFFDSLANL